MLWACLRFPRLALDALATEAQERPSRERTPRAVVDGPAPRRYVLFANAIAQAAGVRAGQPLSTAHALCPRLVASARDAAAERQTLHSLAACAYRFSADVHLAQPDAIFLEVGASLGLFGGWPSLERRLREELARFGFAFALAAAPTATAAGVLATQADGVAIPSPALLANALGRVPLAAAGFVPKIVAALLGMGFRELRDLFRLPRAELGRRIGQAALDHLDRLRGLQPEAWPRWQPSARFERRIEFGFGIESHTALAFPLQRLIRELALFLGARDGAVQRFALVLGHEREATTRVEVGLLAPQRDASSLLEIARARLERIDLPAPVHALELHADDLPPLVPLHRDLFDERRREGLDWPALAERLRARLGDAALQGLACVADQRPDRAWRFVPASAKDSAVAATPTAPSTRPFWLLRRPIALRRAPARILAGPERIEGGWWDDDDQRRDYYVVETHLGQRAWAFTPVGATQDWSLHGWFA